MQLTTRTIFGPLKIIVEQKQKLNEILRNTLGTSSSLDILKECPNSVQFQKRVPLHLPRTSPTHRNC